MTAESTAPCCRVATFDTPQFGGGGESGVKSDRIVLCDTRQDSDSKPVKRLQIFPKNSFLLISEHPPLGVWPTRRRQNRHRRHDLRVSGDVVDLGLELLLLLQLELELLLLELLLLNNC